MQVFYDEFGPLPISTTVKTNEVGGKLLISVNGTCRQPDAKPSEFTITGFLVQIDGKDVGQATIFVQDPNTKFIANVFEVDSPPIGEHTFSIVAFKETPTTKFDIFNMNVQDIGEN